MREQMLQKKNKTSPYCDSKRRQEKKKNKRDLLHRLRNERIERERERERESHTHTQTHAQSIPCAWRLWSYSYRRCTEPLPGKAEGRPWKRSSPPQRPLRTSRTLTTLSFRYQFKFSPKERATASSKRLQCFQSALRLKSSFLYERKSADLEGKTREIPLRERERETPSKLERRALTLLLSRLTSQIEIPELGLIMRSHLRSQKPGLTMRFQLRCQNHGTFHHGNCPGKIDILPSEINASSPDWDPKSRS